MSVYGDYCPYCGEEIEAEDLFEVCDCRGDEGDELKQCPHCYNVFRASLEPVLVLNIQSEEDYLNWLKKEKERIQRFLIAGVDNDYTKYWQERIDERERDIGKSIKYVEKNKNGEWEEDEI